MRMMNTLAAAWASSGVHHDEWTARLRPKPIASSRRLLVPLGAWDRALRRDECGAWCIHGKTGSIHACGRDLQVGAALDVHEATVVVLRGHAGRRGRGMPQVARAADRRKGGSHPRCAGHPEGARGNAGLRAKTAEWRALSPSREANLTLRNGEEEPAVRGSLNAPPGYCEGRSVPPS